MTEALIVESCVRGYHYYQDIWEPVSGEQLECKQEAGNVHDRYAVTVLKEVVVGHVPRKISILCYLFLRKGGTIISTVTGSRRYSRDLLSVNSLISLTAHWLTDTFDRKRAVLHADIREKLKEMFDQWGIDKSRIHLILRDNGTI